MLNMNRQKGNLKSIITLISSRFNGKTWFWDFFCYFCKIVGKTRQDLQYCKSELKVIYLLVCMQLDWTNLTMLQRCFPKMAGVALIIEIQNNIEAKPAHSSRPKLLFEITHRSTMKIFMRVISFRNWFRAIDYRA